jgi:chromosome segregation protein
MRLKSLEIQGFKSFAIKSVFEFDQGVTAIVGPNGSGKSNIADAIRWVLGEQSYTNLRAQKTVDMIFSGSNNRARQGMAYVSIVLDNSDGSLPLDYNEVTIARRAFRSGENEYLINNNRVRLKDIAEILAKGGLARQTYTLVGQGTIDRALSLRASERRQLFEEAAGITYHRQRRAETLRRLHETHQNLLRVNDIVVEIEPRLKRLEKQVSKFEEYQIVRRHLDSLLKVWYGYLWGQGQQTLHHARVRATIGQERLNEEQENFKETEAHIEQLRAHQTQIRNQLGDWHAESSRLHAQAETLQRELAVGEERVRHLASQCEEFINEIRTLQENLKHQQDRADQTKARLTEIETSYQKAKKSLQAVEQELALHKTKRETLLRQQHQAEEQARQAAHNRTDRQSRLAQLAERLKELHNQQQEHIQALKVLQTQQTEVEKHLKVAQDNIVTLEADLGKLNQAQQSKEQKRQTLLKEAQTLAAKLAETEKTLASLQSRQDLLSKLRSDLSGYYGGVKAVLQAKSLHGIRGTVAQLVYVPTKFEIAIEAAVGAHLQDIIVDSWANADAAIVYLKKTRSGRATFLPLDRLRPPGPLKVPKLNGVIGLATDLVEFEPAIKPAVESIFNRLLLVQDLPSAKAVFDAMKGGFQIATQAGEIVRSGGSVTGGNSRQQQNSSFLAREREWQDLPIQIADLEAQLEAIHAEIAQNSAALSDIEATITQLEDQKNTLAQSISQKQKEVNAHTATLSEIKSQVSWQGKLDAKIIQDMETIQAQETTFRVDIDRFTQTQAEAESQAAELQKEVTRLSAETLTAELNQAQSQVAILHEKQQTQQALLKNFSDALNQVQKQFDQRRIRVQSLTEQREALLAQLEAQQAEHKKLVAIVKTFTSKIEPAEVELKNLEIERVNLEDAESKQRHLLRRLEGEANRFSLELSRQQDKMNALQHQIEDDFGLVQLQLSDDQVGQPVLPIQSMVTQLPTADKLPEGIEEDIRHLKVQLRHLGNINPDASREFNELKSRYGFLTSQMADLETAANDLRSVIETLDEIMEQSFTETYINVAKAFQDYFRILFNGGEAQLILTEPENITETGIDIAARPPGKRLQSLELLSGGERSLTAQALIFALLKTSPTPYVIFDEVDAMLDEANVDRFRKALLALSQDIQFIVITHNRKTIEIANTIYGIFMRDDAVSEAISLKLDDFSVDETDQLTFKTQKSVQRK